MGKPNTILKLFKRKNAQSSNTNVGDTSSPTFDILISENSPKKSQRVDANQFDISSLEYDPELHRQIWDYDVNWRDEIQRVYIKVGPDWRNISTYPKSRHANHLRSFQPSWFLLFPAWLEYLPDKDVSFCLPCFLFSKLFGHPTQRVFIIDRFRNWKRVREEKHCAFFNHKGKGPNSFHRIAESSYENLNNQFQHIQNVFKKTTFEQIANNRLQLKALIDVVWVLAFQCVAFRGQDESVGSKNCENFLEILYLTVSYNEQVAEVMAKAPKNTSYTSPMIQKEILHIFWTKVKEAIHDEIGDAKFCIIVDKARDESMKEQMAIVLRFVDKNGFVR